VDAVAQSILEIALSNKSPPPVLNVVHPRPITWSSMIATLCNALNQSKRFHPDGLKLVSFQKWFKLLESFPDSELVSWVIVVCETGTDNFPSPR
jgi:hypothetical protein